MWSSLRNVSSSSRRAAKRKVYALILLLLLLNLFLIGLWYFIRPRPNHNVLAIGSRSSLPPGDSIEITLKPPVDLDFMTRTEVYELRREAVNCYPALLDGRYKPSDAVFKQIKDGHPWWGIPGEFYYGPGEQSILGASEESRFILNPYLLAAAEFYESDIAYGTGLWNWDKSRISEQDLDRADFPYYCPPELLSWRPRDSYARATYNVTQCLADITRWNLSPVTLDSLVFTITAYNARDLNLNYIHFSEEGSQNITFANPFDSSIPEPEFIHRGDSCQYPGGCNNASPYVPQLNDLSLQALPARLTIYLWKDEPGLESQFSPDLTFTLHFK